MFSDLNEIKIGSLESAIIKIGSLAGTEDLIFKNEEGRWDSWEGWGWITLGDQRAKELIESPYELVYSHDTVPPWDVQTGSRCIMLQSDLSAEVYKNFVMNDLEDLSCLRLRSLEKYKPKIIEYHG